jgi:hypothetical protein
MQDLGYGLPRIPKKRTSSHRLSLKFDLSPYGELLFSPSSLRPLLLIHSSYFRPSGMVVPKSEEV